MIAFDMEQVAAAQEGLNNCMARLQSLRGGTEQARDGLGGLSGMEEIIRSLGAQIADLEEESAILSQMSSCLEQCMELYTNRELDIAEYAEETRAAARFSEQVGNNTTPDWAFDLLR